MIGQSNMADRIRANETDGYPTGRILLLNDKDQFADPKRARLNHYSTIRKSAAQVGPGYFFACEIAKQRPDQMVFIVANARGGSSIRQWAKGEDYFDEAVRRTKEAQKYGTLRGIIWHQGETDYKDTDYLPKLVEFVKDLRAALDAPTVPFIAGQITDQYLQINEHIANLSSQLEYCDVVSSAGLATRDCWHFDRKSVTTLGERYAKKILAILAAR